MFIVKTPDGRPACFHCARPFLIHPYERYRQEKRAWMCTIEDDERAAREFHFEKTVQSHMDNLAKKWVGPFSVDLKDIGMVHAEGIRISLEAPPEAMLAKVDVIVSEIRRSIVEALEWGVDQHEVVVDETITPFREENRMYCPNPPPIKELYPNGFVRYPDGEVVALPA
jgi:hypothetical protein